jgi:HK97 family phage prohead protease
MAKIRDIYRHPFSISVREMPDGQTIVGYAAVFDEVAHGEVIRRGAFTKTLSEGRDIKAYWSHDMHGSQVLARRSNGTLELGEDDKGLWVRMRPNLETTWGKDAMAAVARGDVDQMSFGFSPIIASQEMIDGDVVEVLREVRLYEVSLVAEPWYEGTSAAVRDKCSCGTCKPEPRDSHSTLGVTIAEREIELLELTKEVH